MNYFKDTDPVGTYGVNFLDQCLVSINQGELVLIGASSGTGKSTLAQRIAITNSNNGIKTALFSLENSEGDAIRREIYIQYKRITKKWDMSFRDFNKMMYEYNYDGAVLEESQKEAEKIFNNVVLYEKETKGFTLEDLKNKFDKATKEEQCKLIIIDHLDYFDQIEDGDGNENKYLREIMKSIRYMMEVYKVPVIAFSQFRKPTDQKMIIPTQYEFYGSSDKAKIATTVITLAKNFEAQKDECDKTKIHTFIAIRKDRFGTSRVADCVFDVKRNNYLNTFRLGHTDEWGHTIVYDEDS